MKIERSIFPSAKKTKKGIVKMTATGSVRRIDDLGRVVIPKEIRRTMRIREGDPLEIYTDREGEVIFKKYSPIGELAVFAVQYAETLHKTCQLAIVICDRDAVVASAGVPKKDYGDRKISAEFEDLIEKRSFFASKDSSEKICITEGADTFVSCAMPIIAEGDIAGAVASVISDRDQRVCAEDIEEKLIQTAALFLGKQLES